VRIAVEGVDIFKKTVILIVISIPMGGRNWSKLLFAVWSDEKTC